MEAWGRGKARLCLAEQKAASEENVSVFKLRGMLSAWKPVPNTSLPAASHPGPAGASAAFEVSLCAAMCIREGKGCPHSKCVAPEHGQVKPGGGWH